MTTRTARQEKRIPSSIRSFFYDFDGVMTDNRVWVFGDGEEAVACNRGDGWAVARLKEAGYEQCIISTEENPVVSARAAKLKINCIQGCADKREALLGYASKNGIDLSRAAYVGNDENDFEAMSLVGFKICPADATPKIRAFADRMTRANGGAGVIREILDWIQIPGKDRKR